MIERTTARGRGRLPGVLLAVATAAACVVPAADAQRSPAKRPVQKGGVYSTPGYKGTRTLPRTGPAPAPPSVALSADGWKPDVLVDAAGTAHVVWVTNAPAPGNDQISYCRLPRGATACANPNTTPFDPALTPSADFAGPRILQVGDGLVVLTSRYPAVVQHPDGQTRDRTLYAYTSTDGGQTWSPPTIVGTQEASGDAVVFGGAAPRLGVISDTQTGGTVFQSVVPGQYSRATALLGPGDQAYDGSLALEGDQPVAAFADLSGNTIVRRLPAGADPADAAAWTSTVVPGAEEPRLASGPRGPFLLSRAGLRAPYEVRPLTGGAVGAPVPLALPDLATGSQRELAQDPAGALHAVFADAIGTTLLASDSTDGGRSWSPPRTAAIAQGAFDGLRSAAAADGGGVTVYRKDPTGLTSGTIGLSAFGTLSPTGVPGLGALAGGGIPGATAGCDGVRVGDLQIRPQQGCLLPSVDPKYPGASVSEGEVDLMGLILRPDPGVRILLDPRRARLDTTGKVRVLLRGAGLEVTLLHEELHIQFPDTREGGTLLDFDPADVKLAGFPISGRIKVLLTRTGVRIPVQLSLPGAFGGITGDATLLAELGKGVTLDSVKLAVKRAPVGPLEVRDLLISYSGGTETWRGAALVVLPGGAALGADVTFVGGRFTMGDFRVRPPFPGVLIAPNTYFTEVRGGFALDPVQIKVGASFGAFPIAPPSTYTVGVDGDLTLTIDGGSVLLRFDGRGSIAGISLATAALQATTDGYADLTAGYDVDLKAVRVKGSIEGFLDGRRGQFGAKGSADVELAGFLPATGSRAAISNKGFGACYTVAGAGAYVGYLFDKPIPSGVRIGVGCDLTAFTIERPGLRLAPRQVPGGRTFTVTAGTKIQNVELNAAAGSPAVTLIGPDGATVTPADARTTGSFAGPAVALPLPDAARTLVVLNDPKPGVWTVAPAPDSPAITELLVARDAKPVKVTATVTRRGARRVLRYRIADRGGAVVRFSEQGARAAVASLGTATGDRGTLAFTPADGPGGRRQIVALVSRGDLPLSAPVVATYTAPAPQRPATVRGVRARRTSGAVTVRWRAAARATGYVVRVRGRSSGRTLARVLGSRSRSVRITGVSADDGRLTVTVTGRDRRGRLGRASTVRVR
ncbi:hypothetical protein GKE82_00350 [Conexibacter sp. W3-3-2]|uniref:sialidase family protein n=1 Tax=Conexibacter sp. W3-3-2 TaxID=2675227 RepID=UPI0012B78285|nr:sialidase family protein [Conexibacter sp. W3-3-2]MTD42794.1 hypothetical protein [Conexibacter sp. W3-3-2]